jgi:hypothetical protein
MLDVIPGSYFVSAKGFQTIWWSFVVVSAGLLAYANLTGLMLWKIANWLNGKGSLANTRTGVLLSLICFIPLGFSALLIYFAYDLKILGRSLFLLDVISLLSFPVAFAYGLYLSVKIISEIHSISSRFALIVLVVCGTIQVGCLLSLFMLLNN